MRTAWWNFGTTCEEQRRFRPRDGGRLLAGIASRFQGAVSSARHQLPVVITLALAVLVIATLAFTYFGDSRSPYDTCYGTNGRAVPCSVLEALP